MYVHVTGFDSVEVQTGKGKSFFQTVQRKYGKVKNKLEEQSEHCKFILWVDFTGLKCSSKNKNKPEEKPECCIYTFPLVIEYIYSLTFL